MLPAARGMVAKRQEQGDRRAYQHELHENGHDHRPQTPQDGINHYGYPHHQHTESGGDFHSARSEDANGDDLQRLIGNPGQNTRPDEDLAGRG